MRAFVCLERPLSVNAKKTARFQAAIRTSYRDAYPEDDGYWEEMYGLVFYFHRHRSTLDADNLSKPVWDALCGAGFADDRSLKLRIAGIIDRDNSELFAIDLSNVPDAAADKLERALNEEEHVLYIEFGPLLREMFRIGLSVSVQP